MNKATTIKEQFKNLKRQERVIARHEKVAQGLGQRVMGWVRWEKNMLLMRTIHLEIESKRQSLIAALE